MKTAIIIPYYNKWDLTHQRLGELFRHIPPDDVFIVLVNDASPDLDCETGVAFWQKQVQRHEIKYKKNKENLGFGGSMNVGAKIALKYNADILIFLSNDVAISGNFVQQVEAKLAQNPYFFIGGEVIYWDGGWNSFEVGGKKTIIPYANGWFIACTSEVWNMIDGFDPRYGRYDYEDIDISTQALSIGCSIISLNSNHIRHAHQGSTIQSIQSNEDRLELTKRNREKYREKWISKLEEIVDVPERRAT